MPRIICVALNEQLRWESLVNQDYADGSSDRVSLVTESRSFFKITGRLPPTVWQALRNFYIAHVGAAFYFYLLRETVPPYSYDGTGAAINGRYVVVFDGGLSENYTGPGASKTDITTNPTHATGMALVNFALREVE